MEIARPLYESLCISIRDESGAGQARREAQRLALRLGWSEEDCAKFALIVTEASTNIFRHGGSGEVLLRACAHGAAVEMLALDKGPGMGNVERCMEDGFSSAGSRGAGMGAMRRLAAYFDVYSQPDRGTAVFAVVDTTRDGAPPATWGIGVVCVAQEGESIVGDAWAVAELPGRTVLTVLDGLGHGPLAAMASQAGTQAFSQHTQLSPEALLANIHEAVRHTRGAAGAVVDIEWGSGKLRFAGIGNVSGAIFQTSHKRQSCISYNGIVGEGAPRMREFTHDFPGGSLLILASDGLSTRWDVEPYLGLFLRHPALIAGVLYRDFTRHRDDATVLVVRGRPGAEAAA